MQMLAGHFGERFRNGHVAQHSEGLSTAKTALVQRRKRLYIYELNLNVLLIGAHSPEGGISL